MPSRHLVALAFAFALPCAAQTLHLNPTRHAATDLEISGQLTSLAPNAVGYLTREQLLTLPQVSAHVVGNENFTEGTAIDVRGPRLETIAAALPVSRFSDLLEARCDDAYRAHYTSEFLHQHHPILVLTINGQTPAAWAKRTHQYDPSPYFVAYDHFVPAFHILSHADYAQVPANIIRLHFTTAAEVFGPIMPRPTSTAVEQGFAIAKQNCLRCHASGSSGGPKSTYTWTDLANLARNSPGVFDSTIHDPKAINPKATMPGNPQYDAATIASIHAYFVDIATKEPNR